METHPQHFHFWPVVRTMVLSIVLVTSAACVSATTKLDKPIEIAVSVAKVDEVVALYVSPATRDYVDKSFVNVVRYSTRFGDGINLNAQTALEKVFRKVVIAAEFP